MSDPQKNKNLNPSQTGPQMRLWAPVGGRMEEGREEEALFPPPVGKESAPATADYTQQPRECASTSQEAGASRRPDATARRVGEG